MKYRNIQLRKTIHLDDHPSGFMVLRQDPDEYDREEVETKPMGYFYHFPETKSWKDALIEFKFYQCQQYHEEIKRLTELHERIILSLDQAIDEVGEE